MANARPGGPRRPAMDYYEYKRMHEQRLREAGALNERATPVEAAPKPAAQIPYREKEIPPATPAQTTPDLKEELDLPEEKSSLFSGVKALMKGVTSRLPADEPEAQDEPEALDVPDGSEAEAPEGDEEAPEVAPDDEPAEDDDDAIPDDAPQIDNPIGDAIHKVVGLFQSVRSKIAKRAPAQAEPEDDEDEVFAVPETEESTSEDDTAEESAAEESEPVLSRRMRKAIKSQEPEEDSGEPPILDIGPVAAEEVDELVSKPGTTVRADFAEVDAPKADPVPADDEPDDDDDDDDDLPATRGTRLFGFFSKFKGRSAAADEDAYEPDQPDGKDETMQEEKRAALTERLAEELNSAPALSRRERKALAAGKGKPASAAPAAPVKIASPTASAPAASDLPAATMPFSAPTATRPAFTDDEPTQEFRPLRARVAPPAPLDEEDEYDEDDDDDLPPVRRAPKPAKEKKRRRVYKDEDLEDEYDEDRYDEDRYDDDRYDDDRYDDDRYDDDRYDGYDDYDDYDDYDEEDDRYDDDYYVSPGRRFLGFLKGLIAFVLFLALCVLALRQLEASRLISLTGLRQTVGQIIPLDAILPSPPPEVMAPEATAEPEPTAEITQEETATPEDDAASEDEAASTASDSPDLPLSSENP